MMVMPLRDVCGSVRPYTSAAARRRPARGARIAAGRRWWGARSPIPRHHPDPDRAVHRPRLFALAYRLLGAASAAEDTVREAVERCAFTDPLTAATVEARLTAEVVNLCRTRLDVERARRGETWLPEPVPTAHGELGPLDSAAQRDLISLSTLTLLEQLSPSERAVFVLREAFEYAHREIADILDIPEAESQQLYRIARKCLHDNRIRPRPATEIGPVSERFLLAARAGDHTTVHQLLSADAIAISDDATAHSAGRDQVEPYLLELLTKRRPGTSISLEEINGVPAAVARSGRTVLLVAVPEIIRDQVSAVRIMTTPDKLTYLARGDGSTRGDGKI
ncbi:sigma factor-like helix-turn-helix DNA-binding protein [Nocardia macrotermitis]|uniref:RNA polymerase sigma factor 70 region 4 type 2 domain-containing protein n=1 Tax=Nocardia macrotermitis TaxID=2585198 RepID=A0A7K0DD70_9NOCA|nr:sigma factor-like helix-turn-helix DNA-binding protein [Nocardia macrotermitis]MQY23745.1 hypothetical protein [Nocardia macrotermitis]